MQLVRSRLLYYFCNSGSRRFIQRLYFGAYLGGLYPLDGYVAWVPPLCAPGNSSDATVNRVLCACLRERAHEI